MNKFANLGLGSVKARSEENSNYYRIIPTRNQLGIMVRYRSNIQENDHTCSHDEEVDARRGRVYEDEAVSLSRPTPLVYLHYIDLWGFVSHSISSSRPVPKAQLARGLLRQS